MSALEVKRGYHDLGTEIDIQSKVNEWLRWDKNPITREEMKGLYDSKNTKKRTALLLDLLMNRLEFGTAGLRGRMEAGYSRMNDLVVIQTTQGLAAYIECLGLENAKDRGVVIGLDGRYNSERFAQLTAGIFLGRGFRVYLFSRICPTPFVPFCIKEKGCVAGIMITASHNPKYDNGYKVYWDNGAQIIPPRDRIIQASIMHNLEPGEKAWDLTTLKDHPLLEDPSDTVSAVYYQLLQESMLNLERNTASKLIITYTAMHGVGYSYMEEAFKAAKLNPLVAVMEQRDPDPEFPTVLCPNPEEPCALKLSIATATKAESRLIIANDPDADRLAVAERGPSGKWRMLSGNELGALLGWWMFFSFKKRNPTADHSKLYMLGSTVSSKFLNSMAKVEGFNYVETLTGFKWMGNKACQLTEEGNTVLFAFEEAIGFMCGTAVLDKDGISAGVYLVELAIYLEAQGLSLTDKLGDLYQKYGFHLSKNAYFTCRDQKKISRLFNKLRNFDNSPAAYPESLAFGKYPIKYIRDLTTGFDSSQPENKALLPVSASSQMITFTFENGLVATIRTSGTEPKVKYYTEICSQPGQEPTEVVGLQGTLDDMVRSLIAEFMQPEANALESPRD